MNGIRIEFDWTPMMDTLDRIFVQGMRRDAWSLLFPNTLQRVADLAREGAKIWKEKAVTLPGQEGRPLHLNPYVKLSIPDYAASISEEPTDSSGLNYVIGSTDAQAPFIDDGVGKLDLHDVLSTSIKAKTGKKGKYLRIPLRHETTASGGAGGHRFQPPKSRPGQGILTAGVIRAMASKPRYLRTAFLGRTPSEMPGKTVRQFAYSSAKAAQLTANELLAISQRARKHKLSDTDISRLTGLMHVGRKGHGHYLTIRTLSEAKTTGWIIPEYTPKKVSKFVVSKLEALLGQGNYFEDAMKADAAHIATLAGQA